MVVSTGNRNRTSDSDRPLWTRTVASGRSTAVSPVEREGVTTAIGSADRPDSSGRRSGGHQVIPPSSLEIGLRGGGVRPRETKSEDRGPNATIEQPIENANQSNDVNSVVGGDLDAICRRTDQSCGLDSRGAAVGSRRAEPPHPFVSGGTPREGVGGTRGVRSSRLGNAYYVFVRTGPALDEEAYFQRSSFLESSRRSHLRPVDRPSPRAVPVETKGWGWCLRPTSPVTRWPTAAAF